MQGALLAAAALLAALAGDAGAADASFSVQVPAGQSRSVRLRNLPAQAAMAVRVVTSGRLLVALVGEKALRGESPRKALFRATVERRIAFRVRIPESGNYLLVFSNRGGAEARDVQAEIRAVRPPGRKDHSPRPEKASWSPSSSSR